MYFLLVFLSINSGSVLSQKLGDLSDVEAWRRPETAYLHIPYLLGSSSFACFSTDTWLTTPEGKKRMDQIAIGDKVLTANYTSTFFAPVTQWMHREPEVLHKFVTIMTEYGKTLALTSKHLMYRNLCDENYAEFVKQLPRNKNLVYAEELKVGDCVIVLYKNKFRQQRLRSVKITERIGIFAPITSNGKIVVNDMIGSCFSEMKHIKLQSNYFSITLWIQDCFRNLVGNEFYAKFVVPIGSAFSFDVLQLLLPTS